MFNNDALRCIIALTRVLIVTVGISSSNVNKPTRKSYKIFGSDIILINTRRSSIVLIYGFCNPQVHE
ncbi:unnamed protein product [Dovyalis caffra]|uniref:Secreted protein n=1 Tax=Dovyalis caffra TaxID=77055 RepID=A0AAV1S7E3_9ROSI|nr:unnamed protein product [Dovyalis caffra]